MAADTTRFWRRRSDSRGQPPRALIRVFVPSGAMDESIGFYEQLQRVEADAYFPYPDAQLALALVGCFLLIEGSTQALEPFRSTTGTLLVDDIQPYYDKLTAAGADIVVPLQHVPTGAGFNARHPDGSVIEYVHHRPNSEGE